jgi:hypothetical protein
VKWEALLLLDEFGEFVNAPLRLTSSHLRAC